MIWNVLVSNSVLFAVFGAVATQLLGLMERKNIPKPERPDLKDFFYWLPFIISPLIAAGLTTAYIYPTDSLEPFVALNVGVSAPLILRAMGSINPIDRGGIDIKEGA